MPETQNPIIDEAEAMLRLQASTAKLEKQAGQTGNMTILQHSIDFRAAISAALEIIDLRKVSRDFRLLQWALNDGYQGNGSTSEIHGMLMKMNASWAKSVVMITGRLARNSQALSTNILNNIAYRALPCIVNAFDPGTDGKDFCSFAKKYLEAATWHCIQVGRNDLSTVMHRSDLDALLNENGQTGAATQSAADQIDPVLERNKRLCEWAKRNDIHEVTPNDIQGIIILRNINLVRRIAHDIHDDSIGIGYKDLETAGYRMLKGVSRFYDPQEHGENFWELAEKYVIAGIRLFIKENNLDVIPHKSNRDDIERILASAPTEEAPKPDAPSPPTKPEPEVTPPPEEPDAVETTDEPEPAPKPSSPPPPKPKPVPKPPEPKPLEPPKTPAPELKLSPEAEAEQKRKRRFCRWAKTEHGIDVGPDEFEKAVAEICVKHESLAKGPVNRMKIPKGFRGSKKDLRTKAIKMLPAIVRQFDPPQTHGTEGGKLPEGAEHFDQFVKSRLEPQIAALV